jgi:hypothetical protein
MKTIIRTTKAIFLMLIVSCTATILPFITFSQKITGGLVGGTIADISGAVIAGATIYFEGEGQIRETTTSEDGSYNINLPVGSYQMSVKRRAFCTMRRPLFKIEDSASIKFDFTLVGCPIVNDLTIVDGQYKGETDRIKPPFMEETITVKGALLPDLLIRFGERLEKHDQNIVHYRATEAEGGYSLLPVAIMYNSLTIYAEKVVFDRKAFRLTAENYVVVDDGKQKFHAKRADIEFIKGKPHLKLKQ